MGDSSALYDPHTVPTRYWHLLENGRVQCDVCPRRCRLHEGQRGLCFARARVDDQIVLTSYGRSSGFCVAFTYNDPVIFWEYAADVAELGAEVPLHFSAFHPAHKMMDVPGTPAATLTRARRIARRADPRRV